MRHILAVVIVVHALNPPRMQVSDGVIRTTPVSIARRHRESAMHHDCRDLAEAADLPPAADFGFKPRFEVRSFARWSATRISANFFARVRGAAMAGPTSRRPRTRRR
jgi:hypothetical protein